LFNFVHIHISDTIFLFSVLGGPTGTPDKGRGFHGGRSITNNNTDPIVKPAWPLLQARNLKSEWDNQKSSIKKAACTTQGAERRTRRDKRRTEVS
jgi:hypothetical protein